MWALLGKEHRKLIASVAPRWGNMKVRVTGRLTFYCISFCIIYILNKTSYFHFKNKQNKKVLKFTGSTIFDLIMLYLWNTFYGALSLEIEIAKQFTYLFNPSNNPMIQVFIIISILQRDNCNIDQVNWLKSHYWKHKTWDLN